jgi:hypothetical protein
MDFLAGKILLHEVAGGFEVETRGRCRRGRGPGVLAVHARNAAAESGQLFLYILQIAFAVSLPILI